MAETVDAFAAAAPAHPKSVFLMLKQALRNFLASGTAASITIATVPGFVHTAAQAITGTVSVSSGITMPVTVSVQVKQGTTVKTTLTGNVNATTGAWTVTIPANTLAAASHTAVATTTSPAATATSNAFTVT